VHNSAKARLCISPNTDESGKQSLYPDGDSDRHQNLIICSLAHCQASMKKISRKSVSTFYLREVANRQTENDENTTLLAEVITTLFTGPIIIITVHEVQNIKINT